MNKFRRSNKHLSLILAICMVLNMIGSMPIFAMETEKQETPETPVDITAPIIEVEGIVDGQVVTESHLSFNVTVTDEVYDNVQGSVYENIEPIVTLNNVKIASVEIDETKNEYKFDTELNEGDNIINIKATDDAGNESEEVYYVKYVLSSFEFDSQKGEIKGYRSGKPPQELVIPAEIGGIQVKSIGYKAFHYSNYGGKIDTQIRTLILPEGLEVIGEWAFQGNLIEKLNFPSTIMEIQNRAFHGNGLTEVNLPINLTSIGDDAFYNNKLTEVTIRSKVKTIGDSAFKENYLSTVILPEGLERIDNQAFALNNIESITIPETVTKLPTSGNGIVWRNFIDASLGRDDKIQRYTKIYNNCQTTIENTHGLINPVSVIIKYQDESGNEISSPKIVVGKELKKINIIEEETQWGFTKEIWELADGNSEYLTDYNTPINSYKIYDYINDLAPNYYTIGGIYEFEASKIGGYKTPANQTVELDKDNKEIIFTYESLGDVNLSLEGEGLSTGSSETSIGIGTDVEVKITPPFGKEIESLIVNGVDKTEQVKYEDLEHIYRFEILEDTNIKAIYKDDEIPYEQELKIELDKQKIILGEKNNIKAFYRGALIDFPNSGITWTLDHSDIATIDQNTGEVTALKSGVVVITAMLKNRTDIMDTVSLEIRPFKAKVRIEANDRTIVKPKEVTIDNLDLSKYDISTNFEEPRPIHAIIKALESAGIDPNDKEKGLNHNGGIYISMIDGLEAWVTSYYDGWMYYVDNNYPNEGIDSFHIDSGQSIVVFFQEDYMENIFSWFDQEEIYVNSGENITLNLTGSIGGMNGETKTQPVSDATILVNNEIYKIDGKVVKTDENGNVDLIFNKDGNYHISAEKINADTGRRILTRPYAKVSVVVSDVEIPAPKDYKALAEGAVDKGSDWLISNFSDQAHWSSVAIARAGKQVPASYLERLNKGETLPSNQQGQYGKFILGILAAGGDPENIGGHNLYEDMIENVDYSNLNMWGLPWDLAALNATNYELPENVDFTREDLIQKILSKKVEGGGFSGFGSTLDVEATGFATVALHPYYGENQEVKAALDKAINRLSEVQNQDGGFKGDWGNDSNINSAAQALMAITLMGEDPTSEKFTKEEGNLLEYIFSLQNEDGSFNWKHSSSGAVGMVTEQAVYALDQYLYSVEGKGSIWDFTRENSIPEEPTPEEPEEPGNPDEEDEDNESTNPDPLPQPTPVKGRVTLSIDKKTIGKGYVLNPTKVEFTEGESVWDVLKKKMDSENISYDYDSSSSYDSIYIKSIAGDGELDHGSGSGWKYSVNGYYPDYGISNYTLSDEDMIEIRYTTNLGEDLGSKVEDKETEDNKTSGGTPSTDESAEKSEKNDDNKDKKEENKQESKEESTNLEKTYKDSDTISSWAREAIKKATALGFIQGSDGKVNPKSHISRGEFTKIIVSMLGLDANIENNINFTDVNGGDWFYSYVNAAYKAGIIKGDGEKFNPNDNISREQMATIIVRALGLKHQNPSTEIKDIDKVSPWAREDVETLVALGLMTGNEGRFDPKSNATREMAVVVAMRGYEFELDEETLEEKPVEDEKEEQTEHLDIEKPIEGTTKLLQEKVINPTLSSVGGGWTVLGLSRSDIDVPDEYYNKYYKNVENILKEKQGNLHRIKYTEYDRVILALTAIGKDVTDVAGYNLLKPLADFNTVIKQGINGPIFALIALDSNDYEIPLDKDVKVQTTRDMLVRFILDREIEGGGWALAKDDNEPDPDITAMAIQGLTPYYSTNKDVKTAVDRAISWLSKAQEEDGGYSSWESGNSESIAQVIVALTGMGIDPHNDSRFVKNGNSAMENLLSFREKNGGFYHMISAGNTKLGETNIMATEQAMYALSAYNRFINDGNRLYNMTDVK